MGFQQEMGPCAFSGRGATEGQPLGWWGLPDLPARPATWAVCLGESKAGPLFVFTDLPGCVGGWHRLPKAAMIYKVT